MVSYKDYNPQGKTINGIKTAKKKLGLELFEELKTKTAKQLKVSYPPALHVVLRSLYIVWKWPENKKKTFWIIYNLMLDMLIQFWMVHGAPTSGSSFTENNPVVWNAATWVNAIVKFMILLKPVGNKNWCWRLQGNFRDEPKVKLTCGTVPSVPGKTQRFTANGVGDKLLFAYRFTAMLNFPDHVGTLWDYDTDQQWCHRCYSRPQLCCNPAHGVIGTDTLNKSMHKCVNGAAFYCNHDPKCIYVDSDGRPIPCRNKKAFPTEPCMHKPNCHTVLPGYRNKTVPEDL